MNIYRLFNFGSMLKERKKNENKNDIKQMKFHDRQTNLLMSPSVYFFSLIFVDDF